VASTLKSTGQTKGCGLNGDIWWIKYPDQDNPALALPLPERIATIRNPAAKVAPLGLARAFGIEMEFIDGPVDAAQCWSAMWVEGSKTWATR